MRALSYAVSLAADYNAELILLHVLEETPAHREEAIAAATVRLKKLVPEDALPPGRLKTVVRIGRPYLEIIQIAKEEQNDIVVMTARGRSVQDVAVFGATTYRVIQLGPSRVLVVHI
jgi:nucleotide-binding universal stress UspA family protein